MAYVVGFIAADGNLTKNKRGAHFIAIQSVDRGIVYAIRQALRSNLQIGEYRSPHKNWRKRYSLQIGSKKMYQDLLDLGITPKKAYRIRMPSIPVKYLRDFIRGYFDGDGGVTFYFSNKKERRNPTPALSTSFTSCSKGILRDIAYGLYQMAGTRLKVPTKKGDDNASELRYSTNDSRRIYRFLYSGLRSELFLQRKKVIFEKYLRA